MYRIRVAFADRHLSEHGPRRLLGHAAVFVLAGQFRAGIAVVRLAPAAVGVLLAAQPLQAIAHHRQLAIDTGEPQARQHAPGAVDVVGAPASPPAAIGLLRVAQVLDAALACRSVLRTFSDAKCQQHAAGDVLGWRIEQSAVIGERDRIEKVAIAVRIERAKAAVARLQADDPVQTTRHGHLVAPGLAGALAPRVKHRQHDGRIVNVRVVRVLVLKCPAARRRVGRSIVFPVAAQVQHLTISEPVIGAGDGGFGACVGRCLLKRHHAPGCVPHRRQAGLAIRRTIVAMDHELLQRGLALHPQRMILRVAEQHHHFVAVHHRREDAAEAVFTVHAGFGPFHRALDGAAAQCTRNQRFEMANHAVRDQERLLQSTLAREVFALQFGRRDEQFLHVHAKRILRGGAYRAQHQQRHHRGTRPVGHLVHVDRRPARKQHEFHRHERRAAPRDLAEGRQQDAREHVRLRRAAARQDGFARPDHMRRIRRIARRLQREVGFDAAGDIEIAAEVEVPCAMAVEPLHRAQVLRHAGLQRGVDLVDEVHHQDVLGRDGGIAFEFETPVAVGVLAVQQCVARADDRSIEFRCGDCFSGHAC